MDCQIQGNGNPRDCSVSNELSVAEKCSCAMVISMEESQGLLFQDKEDGVNQFEVFGQVVHLQMLVDIHYVLLRVTYIVESDQRFGPATLVTADGIENPTIDQSGQKLLNEESQ